LHNYHNASRSNPNHYQTDHFRELFSFGLVSPIVANQDAIKSAFQSECELMCSVPMIDLKLDDPLGKKRLQWNKKLRRFFNSLLDDDHILTIVYEMTERMILDYLHNNPDGAPIDEVSQKFSEYIVREIGSAAYESKIRFSIQAMINVEKRPLIPLTDVTRHLTQMYPTHFSFSGGFFESFQSKPKLEVDVYGDDFNEAYLRSVADKLSENIYRNVAVNLLDNMVQGLLEMTIDMFSRETVLKEKKKVNDKVNKLKETKKIIEKYL